MENINLEWIEFKNKLKDIKRSGWKYVGVPVEKSESIYAHIGATKDLVSEFNEIYNLELDIPKINKMITINELPKIIKKEDPFYPTIKEEESEKIKDRKKLLAIKETFNLPDEIITLYDEAIARQTKEAEYALMFSKFESDLQAVNYYHDGLMKLEAVQEDIKGYPEDIRKKAEDILEKYPIPPLAWLTFNSQYYKGNQLFEQLSSDLINDCINEFLLNTNDNQKTL